MLIFLQALQTPNILSVLQRKPSGCVLLCESTELSVLLTVQECVTRPDHTVICRRPVCFTSAVAATTRRSALGNHRHFSKRNGGKTLQPSNLNWGHRLTSETLSLLYYDSHFLMWTSTQRQRGWSCSVWHVFKDNTNTGLRSNLQFVFLKWLFILPEAECVTDQTVHEFKRYETSWMSPKTENDQMSDLRRHCCCWWHLTCVYIYIQRQLIQAGGQIHPEAGPSVQNRKQHVNMMGSKRRDRVPVLVAACLSPGHSSQTNINTFHQSLLLDRQGGTSAAR